MEEMILNNTKLIYVVLKDMNLFDQREYYYDIGMLGLIKAVNTFDADKGYVFSTYATRCIRNQILMDIRKNKKDAHNNIVSLDDPVPGTEDLLVKDTISSDFDMEDDLIKKEEVEIMWEAFFKLDPEEQIMLLCYYNPKRKNDSKRNRKNSKRFTSYG